MRRLAIRQDGLPCGVDRLVRFASQGIDLRNWYADGLRQAKTVCQLEGWNLERFLAVMAITSPKVSVSRNIRTTFRYMSGNGVFGNTLTMVQRSLAHYEETGEIGIGEAPKVNAFYRALLGDSSAIVLDVWMGYALRVEQKRFDSKRFRQLCERKIEQTAKRIGRTNSETQAMIWGGVNREYGRAPAWPNIVSEYDNWLAHNRSYPHTGLVEVLTDVN